MNGLMAMHLLRIHLGNSDFILTCSDKVRLLVVGRHCQVVISKRLETDLQFEPKIVSVTVA